MAADLEQGESQKAGLFSKIKKVAKRIYSSKDVQPEENQVNDDPELGLDVHESDAMERELFDKEARPT